MTDLPVDVAGLVERYRVVKTEWAGIGLSKPSKRANRLFVKAHKIALQLRATEDGRADLI